MKELHQTENYRVCETQRRRYGSAVFVYFAIVLRDGATLQLGDPWQRPSRYRHEILQAAEDRYQSHLIEMSLRNRGMQQKPLHSPDI